MKFAVEKLSSVIAEINALEKEQQDLLNRDYEIIICGTVDPRIIESLRKSGRVIQYSIRQ